MNRNDCFYWLFVLFLIFPVIIEAQHNQDSWQQDFQEGLSLFEKGLYAEAAVLLKKARENSTDNNTSEAAHYYHARALTRLDSAGTEVYVDEFIQKYPKSSQAAVLLREVAEQHMQRGQLAVAIERMDEALNFPQPGSRRAELYYTLGEAAAENGEYARARRYFLALANEHRRSEWAPKALYARGRLYIEEGQFTESAEAFELLRERYPFDPMTRRIGTALGESYYQQGMFHEAIEAFQAALPNLDDESRSKAVYLMAESYNALHEFADATRYYRQFINRARDEEEARIAHYGLGWVYHKQEIYHWAAESFERAAFGDDELARKALYYKGANEKLANRYDLALETFRKFGRQYSDGIFWEPAYFEWAVIAFEVGLYGEAIDALLPLARNVDELENPGEALTFLGEVYYANGEYTRAEATFEMAEQLTDISPELIRQARFQRAWVQYSNQAYTPAQEGFEKVHNDAPDSELGSEALFWSADAHYQRRNFGPAAVQYTQFIQRYPDHELVGAAKYGVGWAYFMMGDFENAIEPLVDFLRNYDPPPIALFPYDTDTQLRIGDSFFALGRYNEALETYNMAIDAEPGGDYAIFQAANSYYRMNRNFEAVTEFRRLLRVYPQSRLREQAQYNVAYIYLHTGNFDQAVEEFHTIINQFPGTEWAARAQYNIGDAYYNAGDYDEAIRAYQQVLDNYPRSNYILDAIDGIQFAQLSAGGDDTSTNVLEEFVEDNPTSTTADRLRFRQAENRMQAGDYEAAIAEFSQYLRITNNRELIPDATYNLADAYLRTGRRAEAVETYETLVADFPDSERAAPALAALGRIQYDMGNYEASKQRFEELYQANSRYRQEALLGLGNAELALNRNGAARQNFEQVLSTNANNDAARVGMGRVLLNDGRTDEARRFFTQVVESSSTEAGAEAQYRLGEAYLAENNREAAREEFARVRVLFGAYESWVAEAQYRTAEIYIQEGRRGDAISLLNSTVASYPGTSGATKATRLLQSLQ